MEAVQKTKVGVVALLLADQDLGEPLSLQSLFFLVSYSERADYFTAKKG